MHALAEAANLIRMAKDKTPKGSDQLYRAQAFMAIELARTFSNFATIKIEELMKAIAD